MVNPLPERRCKHCNALITERRRRFYCSGECNAESLRIRTRLRDDAKVLPCPRCGGPKEPGKRRYCAACRDALLPIWRQKEYQRSVEKNRKAVAERALVGRKRVVRRGEDDTLRCAGCEEYLPQEKFSTAGAGKWNSYCKACYSHYLHERDLKMKYGIDGIEYQRLLQLQDGRCAICLKQPRKMRLAVDHDHSSGAVRGLLCSRCNHKLLGGANDSVTMLNRAASYLEAPPAITGKPPTQLPAWWEQRLEQAVEEAEDIHAADPAKLPVAWVEVPDSEQKLAVMTGSTFLGLLTQYEKHIGVPLSIAVQET